MKRIYLDHAAAAPLDQEVYEHMLPYFGKAYGNPSSLHESGRRAAQTIAEARRIIGRIIGASAEEIIFTGSGTEADNLALGGHHIIISAIEHKAVIERARMLEHQGSRVSIAPVDHYGRVDIPKLLSLVEPKTDLVSVMLANNELGTIQPIAHLAGELRKRSPKILLHTDACQAAGHLPLNVSTLGVDLLTLNGSKAYGPRGIGLLYAKRGVKLSPLIVGGGQERGIRAGTESVPLIAGFAKALVKAECLRKGERVRLWRLRRSFVTKLKEQVPDIIINGHPDEVLPHIVHVSIPAVEGEALVLMLDAAGVEAATGSACSAKDLRPSHVLIAIGQDENIMHGSLRFSFGRETSKEDLEYTAETLGRIVRTLTSASALTSHQYATRYARV